MDVGLVRHPEQQQPRAFDRQAGIVERIRDLLDDEERHRRVDLVRRLDQSRRVAVLAQPPSEEVRDDRYAVAAEPRARVVGEEAERLRGRSLAHFPGRDPEPVAHQRQLVRQRDLGRAIVQLVTAVTGRLEHAEQARLAQLGDRRLGNVPQRLRFGDALPDCFDVFGAPIRMERERGFQFVDWLGGDAGGQDFVEANEAIVQPFEASDALFDRHARLGGFLHG